MKKILLIALCLGFAVTQSIQTKQVEITITDIGQFETTMGDNGQLYYDLNVGEYISLLEGEYMLQLASFLSVSSISSYAMFEGRSCNGSYSGFWWNNNSSACPLSEDCNTYGGEPLRINYDCQSMFFEQWSIDNILQETSSFTIKFWVTGMFEDELLPPTGDLNTDGQIDVVDVVILVNSILEG